ncbi:MAG: hypothetical protein EBR88_08660, partial [Betaproteobacteria bacterium]|nr:hypothetical protein [Betaproteobacteria bacterium]
PLLRQIEAMQESSNMRVEALAGVERTLNLRLSVRRAAPCCRFCIPSCAFCGSIGAPHASDSRNANVKGTLSLWGCASFAQVMNQSPG